MEELKELKLFLKSFEKFMGLPEGYYLVISSCIDTKFPVYKSCNIEIKHPLSKDKLVKTVCTKKVETADDLEMLYREALKNTIVEVLRTLKKD